MPAVIVVGAGPAGLATSYALTQARIDHIVLEAGEVGQTWATLYDSLVLHTGKHMSALPGSPFSRSTPLFPERATFLEYLRRYATSHALPIQTRTRVSAVRRGEDGWLVDAMQASSDADADATDGDDAFNRGGASQVEQFQCRVLVWATGVVSNPSVPDFVGRETFGGEVLHSVDYHRPERFLGRRVLVVGTGNSGGEIAAELAHAGASVAIAARSGTYVVPRTIAGVPIQYAARFMSRLPQRVQRRVQHTMSLIGARLRGPTGLPLPGATDASPLAPPRDSGTPRPPACRNVPLIGFHLTDAIRARLIDVRPAMAAFVADGVRFADGREELFEVVLFATGYRPALGPLDGLVQRDACGFARRSEHVVSLDQPDLYFVGQSYDVRGAILNIGRDAQHVARLIVRTMGRGTES
jgi:putative flavoprotein involved in K+ transport